MLLPRHPRVPENLHARLRSDHDRFAKTGLPGQVESYLRETYGIDVGGRYAGNALKNPWGLASGQLSMKAGQVESAAAAGLGFVVLKTVIAQDAKGDRTMEAWAVKESRMVVERIAGRNTNEEGWTVTWKGRGWWQTFPEYLELVRASVEVGRVHGMLVVPSVKYHLPGPGEEVWRVEEYEETTLSLLKAYGSAGDSGPMPLEKDFSPTLAGSERSRQQEMILGWLERVPGLIRASVPQGHVRVGLKLFNSLEDDPFQLSMLASVHRSSRPDYLVYANRLFDPDRVFEGHRGVAYGGPDLSDRNLRILSELRGAQGSGRIEGPSLEISGTGDIRSGRLALEYALRGCTSFQMHTLFQLPLDQFAMTRGERFERALHRLYFDPDEGLVVWMLHAGERLGLKERGEVRLLDIAARGAESELTPVDLDA
jgi:hypothetical protein